MVVCLLPDLEVRGFGHVPTGYLISPGLTPVARDDPARATGEMPTDLMGS